MAATRKPVTSSPEKRRSAWNDGPWNEIAGIVLIGIGLVILIALLSYTSNDPSYNTTGKNQRAHNLIGPVGANIADILFQMFGLAALLVPFTFGLAGLWQWQDDRAHIHKPKILGIFLMIISLTGALTMIGSDRPDDYYLGGFIGRWLLYADKVGLSYLLGPMGAIVALLIAFISGLVIATDFSVIAIFMRTNTYDREPGMFSFLGQRIRTWRQERDNIRGQRETTEQLKEKLQQRRRTPVIARQPSNQKEEIKIRNVPPASPKVATRVRVQDRETEFENPTDYPIDYPDYEEDNLIEQPAVKVLPPVEKIPPISAPKTKASPANGSPAIGQKQGGQKQAHIERRPAEPEIDDSYLDGDLPAGDFGDIQPTPAARSVDEMMATASVKRAEVSPEDEKPVETSSKVKKAATAITRFLSDYKLPSTEMLTPPSPRSEMEETELLDRARQLAEKCAEFNVSGQVKQISPGPVVTTFEFKPDPGVKYSRVTSLVDDLCLALRAESIRIDRIPGKSTVGIEVPNTQREIIRLREVIESKKFRESGSKLTIALGKTIDGSNSVADLAKMPHLLIAGATGAGKSVMLNAILVSLLYKASPNDVKMILVDPKRLELGLYVDIPHLLTPIVTDPKRASYALKWAVSEMETRYKHLAAFGVRNIEQYNNDVCATVDPKAAAENGELPAPLPYIVVIIDELSDLMMVSARDVEESITRLAQMARAVGIHLVLATQRPSVDVITGLIKANFPSRISFRVSSKVDSRTIIDTNGAEALLGSGDMLFLPPGTSRLVRVHGAYIDEKEVKRICDFVRSQGNPAYDEKVVMSEREAEGGDPSELAKDEKYDDAVRIVVQSGKASTSLLQRHLRIGYGRAASIIDMMYREGIVGPEDGSKPRQVLVKPDFLERLDQIRDES
jgi:DNA segregation ATPase FtsK/SpoIIIE, S-DNA-T family